MRRLEDFQTRKPKPAVPYRPRIVDRLIDTRSTDARSMIYWEDIPPLDFRHISLQPLWATHTRNLISVKSNVETPSDFQFLPT